MAWEFYTLKLYVFGEAYPVPMASGICEPEIAPSVYNSTDVIGQVEISLTMPESSNVKSSKFEIS